MCYEKKKRKTQAGSTCELITNERIGGGWSCSSDEIIVMMMERRASIMQFLFRDNLEIKDDF